MQAAVDGAGGGKSGGREMNANGQVASLERIQDAEDAAKAFLTEG